MDAKDMAFLADRYYEARELRLEADREAKRLTSEEYKMKKALISAMEESEITAVGGELVTVELVPKEKPAADDWDKVYAHILETGEFDLLHKRLTERAVKERWELDEEIPGVKKSKFNDLSIHKRKSE